MYKIKYCLILLLIFIGVLSARSYDWQDPDKSDNERIAAILKELTLEQKATLLMSRGDLDHPAIPKISFVECLHGVARKGKATVFPQSIGLAATFDTDLMFRVASAISDEARAKHIAAKEIGNYIGINALSPNINIFRDPRWGRGQETYGEDPYLTSQMGVAFVKGLQGNDPRYLKVSACAKHYAVHSGPEPMRHVIDPNPSKKDLFETYLPAFEMLIKESDVATVMATYNKVYGRACFANEYFLVDILRDKWGFDGIVMSDGGAIKNLYTVQNAAESPVDASAMCLNNGLDYNLGGTFAGIPEAVERGLLEESLVDSALARWLKIQLRLGKFDPPGVNPYDNISTEVINCEAHRKLAREAAQKSIVLLKNDNVLPLDKKIKRLYMVGNNAMSSLPFIGNYYGLNDNMPSVLEAVIGKVHPGSIVEFRPGVRLDQYSKTLADWTDISHRFDAIIAVMGINSMMEGEEGSAIASADGGDRLSLHLPGNQMDYLRQQRSYGDKPIIVVLFGGSPIIDEELYELADAVLFAWYPGEEGGNAVADIIFGDAVPAGRLPVTFPKSEKDLPNFADYTMAGRTYRFMEKEPLFPFGYGLSYSEFSYDNLQLNQRILKPGDALSLSFAVTNDGEYDCDEAIQLYLTGGVDIPNYTLVGFDRVHIKSGETQKIKMTVEPDRLTRVNEAGEILSLKGDYEIQVSGSLPGFTGYAQKGFDILTERFRVK
ncbi:MAG: glycoside hydrolase family 3 N-terminal domain-containing protein [Fidelibacterota bacterium]